MKMNKIMTTTILKWTWPLLLVGLYVGATGCRSFKGTAPGYLTSVTITNRPMVDVTNATVTVFTTHGFNVEQSGPGQFIFRRLGNAMDQIAYGSYVVKQAVTVKAQVILQQTTPDSILIGCDAWLVKSEGDPAFAESYPVGSMRKGPYEELLEDIKKQLNE
jgi:hypothetical protein